MSAAKRQLTYSNVAIRIKTAKRFYELQKSLIEHCGFIWRGRENNPKYEESYDNLVNLFKEDFLLIFPNDTTIDVVNKDKKFSIEQSGRVIIEMEMTIKGLEKTFEPRSALLYRLQAEYEQSFCPKPAKPAPIKKKANKIETMLDIFEGTGNIMISSDFIGKNPDKLEVISYPLECADSFAMLSDQFPMAKPKQKKSKLSKKKSGSVVSLSPDELTIIPSVNKGVSLSLSKLETMLLISK